MEACKPQAIGIAGVPKRALEHIAGMDSAARYRAVKRLFDIVFSAGVLVVGAVPGALLCVAIAFDMKGNPIYTQVRAGQGGVPFRIFKFRTMPPGADSAYEHLSPEQFEAWCKEAKVEDDPRVTKFGALLRAASIDEFPQFANVLLGQMSVVGPRPITFEELKFFGDHARELLSVRPGITGLWQTGPRNEALFETGQRQAIELEYVRNASLALDAKLILKTFRAIARKTGK